MIHLNLKEQEAEVLISVIEGKLRGVQGVPRKTEEFRTLRLLDSRLRHQMLWINCDVEDLVFGDIGRARFYCENGDGRIQLSEWTPAVFVGPTPIHETPEFAPEFLCLHAGSKEPQRAREFHIRMWRGDESSDPLNLLAENGD